MSVRRMIKRLMEKVLGNLARDEGWFSLAIVAAILAGIGAMVFA